MTFAHPQLLWLLLLPAALLLAALLSRARTTATTLPNIPRIRLGSHLSSFGLRASVLSPRPAAAILSLALLIAALARPQGATLAASPSFTQARDVLVAVDVSRSMLADDVAPTRLARAQLLVRNLADELRGERIGLLPFAGTAFLQSPLSADYEIFRTFLDELGPDMIPAGGSDFTALLRAADEAFGPAESTAPDAPPAPDRYLVVLSDGEAQDDSWQPLAQQLSARGVRILALGLGTTSGAMVPDGKGGLTKDARGAAVLTRLNPATLEQLARLTDGAYRDASAWVDLPALLSDTISRGRAARVATDTAPRRQELFPWFLAPALALLALALLREYPVPPRLGPVSINQLPSALPPDSPAKDSRLPSGSSAARLLALAAVLHSSFFIGHSSFASEAPPPDALVTLVAELSAAPAPAPADLARLADLTAARGESARSAPSSAPLPPSAIQDALAAVTAGEAASPTAADWPALRQRLQALLAPPPEQPKPDQSKPDQSKPDKSDSKKSDPEKSDSEKSDSEKSAAPQSSDPSQKKSFDTSPGEPSGSRPGSDPSPTFLPGSDSSPTDPSYPTSPKPHTSKPLADLAQPPPAPEAPPSPDEPTQTAGGVSASGRPADASASDTAALDPALALPNQRLERVRDSDAPARLFQLLQDSEIPPEERARRAAAQKQDW